MKAEIIETKKEFEPIEIRLVIESAEELCDLLNRLNPLAKDIDKINSKFLKHGALNASIEESKLWQILFQVAEEKKLTL